jgi:hypothetical protein
MFSLQQNRRVKGQIRFCPEAGGGGRQRMYTRVSKCKNDIIKERKKAQCVSYFFYYSPLYNIKAIDTNLAVSHKI